MMTIIVCCAVVDSFLWRQGSPLVADRGRAVVDSFSWRQGSPLVADRGPLTDKCRLAESVQSSVSWFS
jgi:hypothetical protein